MKNLMILTQDKDEIFQMGSVYFDEKSDEGNNLLGFNVYGYHENKGFGDVLLGTYDTEEEAQAEIINIYNAIKVGKSHYEMEEGKDDLDE